MAPWVKLLTLFKEIEALSGTTLHVEMGTYAWYGIVNQWLSDLGTDLPLPAKGHTFSAAVTRVTHIRDKLLADRLE